MIPAFSTQPVVPQSKISRSVRTGLVVAAWISIAAAISLWLLRTPDAELPDTLRRWQFWSLETTFVLLAALTWINIPRFIRSFDLRVRDIVLPAVASVAALLLTGLAAPRTNRIYYDEHIYQAIGHNLTDLRLAQMCNDGNAEYGRLQCWRGEYNKEPYAYPYLLSVVYRITGVRENTAFVVNTVVAALAVWVVYFLATAIGGRPDAGGYAALVTALIPEQLRWSHSAAAEPSAALACAFAVLTCLAFARDRSTPAALWVAAATAFAVQFRPESILTVAVIAIVIVAYAPEELRTHRTWAIGAMAAALLAVHIAHLIAVRNEGWGSSGPKFSMAYVSANLAVNGWFYLADARFPSAYGILAVMALWRPSRGVLVAALYFLLFWGVFLVFYAGSFNYGADDRFSLMTFVPLAVMAGISISRLCEALDRSGWLGRPSRTVVTAALVVQFLWYMPFVRTVGEEAWGARADVEFARSAAKQLPPNSFVLTHNPGMFHLLGISAGQASIAANESEYAERVLAPRYAGGVYFHWNFWCNVTDPVQQAFCTSVLQRFPHTLVHEARERDYRYALYRLDVRRGDTTR
jgi:hypothetical protein